MDYKLNVVTRFAPSPTGFLHIGGYRTALFNYLFARQSGGKFILRIEDTDKERSKKEYEKDILDGLKWLGLEYDQIYRQSERLEIYKNHLQKIIDSGKAYISKESVESEIDGRPTPTQVGAKTGLPDEALAKAGKRSEVIRFKNPNLKIKFKDLIRGEVEFDTTELGDFVIAKSLTEPLYHLAAVIDDFEMGITHIIRGEEHISNTPRQILIQRAIEASEPIYAHIPLILAPDRSKLSKRHGAPSLSDFIEKGYLKDAILNYIALLGWNPGGNREVMSLSEIIKDFNISRVQKGGAIFNIQKLDWLNREHIKKMGEKERNEAVRNYIEKYKKPNWNTNKLISQMIDLITEKIQKWEDVKDLIENGELDWFFEEPELQNDKITWKEDLNSLKAIKHLQSARAILKDLQEDQYNAKIIKEKLLPYAEENGKGSVLWPLRYALTGQERSPDPFITSEILGKKKTFERWEKAINILKQNQ